MIVVKIGGSILQKTSQIAQDLHGRQFVLVHGIGPQADQACRQAGIEPRWVTSTEGIRSRYTDAETLRAFTSAASGENTRIAATLQAAGINAVGLNAITKAVRKQRIKIIENNRKLIIDGDFTGKIENINAQALTQMLDAGITPIVSPIAVSENHELLNVNADRLASFIAGSLHADAVINLTNVPGVLDPNGQVIKKIQYEEIEALMKKNSGGIVIKLLAAKEAIDLGVPEALIASGLATTPISNALNKNCTVICK